MHYIFDMINGLTGILKIILNDYNAYIRRYQTITFRLFLSVILRTKATLYHAHNGIVFIIMLLSDELQ